MKKLKVVVVGVGQTGVNVINDLLDNNIVHNEVTTVALDSDISSLKDSNAVHKFKISVEQIGLDGLNPKLYKEGAISRYIN